MKTKLSKPLFTAVLTGLMALGAGTSLVAQDQSMDKPSASGTEQVDQAPPSEQTAPQYNAPDQSAQQDVAPRSQDQDAYQQPAPPAGPNQRQYTSLPPEQLDKLVAPIALYPDALVAQILAASAYPTQIVEADRMAKENPELKGKDLADKADQQDWDPSVKSLVEFPTVLANLDKNLSWTSELGEAYQNQPDDVMQAIQHLRHKARDAGNLRSTPQERVYDQGANVDIEPADPNVVYVPAYNPAYVYGYPVGVWPGFYPWWGFGGGPVISFGLGFPIWPFFGFGWGWHGWHLGWGFHGGIFFGGHPYAFHSRGFYNHAAFVHGNYRGFSSARGAFRGRTFAGRETHGFAGGNRGASINRHAESNRAFANNRGFSGGERGFGGRAPKAPRTGGSSGGRSHGSSSRGGFRSSHGGGHSGSGHGGGGHGGRR